MITRRSLIFSFIYAKISYSSFQYQSIHTHKQLKSRTKMDHRDEFFLNASFTIFSGSALTNYNSNTFPTYLTKLQQYLKIVFESTPEASTSNYLPIQVKHKHWEYNYEGRQYSIKMVYIRYMETLHRFCIITRQTKRPDPECVVFSNASAEVLEVFRYSLLNLFGCSTVPITISKTIMLGLYEKYISLNANLAEYQDSEILFDTDTSSNGKLKTLTIGVTGSDVPNFLKIAESGNLSLSEIVMTHVEDVTGFNSEEVSVYRINCGGFILMRRGKLKLFNEPVWTMHNGKNLWMVILSIFEDVTKVRPVDTTPS